jgi:hypothetical protein
MMFTEMDRAVMAGGHSLEPRAKGLMSFVKELHEARLIRSASDVRRMNYADVCENLYLSVLTLDFMSRFKETKSWAVQYARQTAAYNNYREFRLSGTDLYNMIHFVDASPNEVTDTFNSKDAGRVREQTHLPIMGLNGWLLSLDGTGSRDTGLVMRLEQALRVYNSDYKEIRRFLSSSTIAESDLMRIKTKILYYFRAKMTMSDMLPTLESVLTKQLS